MATAAVPPRNPLATRHQSHNTMSVSPYRTTLRKASSATKRAHSPEPADDTVDHSSKRVKTTTHVVSAVQPSPTAIISSRADARKDKGRREKERIERELEFKVKYSRAFPNWVFYFDLDTGNPEVAATRAQLEKRVLYMDARIDKFFSKDITHFITLHDIDDKENKDKEALKAAAAANSASGAGAGALLGSPIRLRGRAPATATPTESLVQKARSFNMKIWSATKLDNILDRCEAPRVSATGPVPAQAQHRSRENNLARLLHTERLHGTTERDPTQRRNDYTYFSKDGYFVLVEDLRGELATIVAAEYAVFKGKDGKDRGAWPVLHMHPLARGPFMEYDEKEERRRQKAEKAEAERQEDKARRKARLIQHEKKRRAHQMRMQGAALDLRRCMSLNNLKRRATCPEAGIPGFVDLDADFVEDGQTESAHASGYLASGAYMAASGNSVSITSTTGTTSTAGGLLRSLQLPAQIQEKMRQQVSMSRRALPAPAITEKANKENLMGPPPTIPDRAKFLRKSKSTNTLKLPKRDEASKPGYCESCRQKFEDFREHIAGRRHRKFATDDSNFKHLDAVLSRVKRRTIHEVAQAEEQWYADAHAELAVKDEEDEPMLPEDDDDEVAEDVRWDEWVDAANCQVEV